MEQIGNCILKNINLGRQVLFLKTYEMWETQALQKICWREQKYSKTKLAQDHPIHILN